MAERHPGPDGAPVPDQIETVADLVRHLRLLREYEDLSITDVTARSKPKLGRSTVGQAQSDEAKLPRLITVRAYVRGCGLSDDALLSWDAAWRRARLRREQEAQLPSSETDGANADSADDESRPELSDGDHEPLPLRGQDAAVAGERAEQISIVEEPGESAKKSEKSVSSSGGRDAFLRSSAGHRNGVLARIPANDSAELLSGYGPSDRLKILGEFGEANAAKLLAEMTPSYVGKVFRDLHPAFFRQVLPHLETVSGETAKVLFRLDPSVREQLLISLELDSLAWILMRLSSSDRRLLFTEMSPQHREQVLLELPAKLREEVLMSLSVAARQTVVAGLSKAACETVLTQLSPGFCRVVIQGLTAAAGEEVLMSLTWAAREQVMASLDVRGWEQLILTTAPRVRETVVMEASPELRESILGQLSENACEAVMMQLSLENCRQVLLELSPEGQLHMLMQLTPAALERALMALTRQERARLLLMLLPEERGEVLVRLAGTASLRRLWDELSKADQHKIAETLSAETRLQLGLRGPSLFGGYRI
jgi:Mg/Co/Ni transporter MgtE